HQGDQRSEGREIAPKRASPQDYIRNERHANPDDQDQCRDRPDANQIGGKIPAPDDRAESQGKAGERNARIKRLDEDQEARRQLSPNRPIGRPNLAEELAGHLHKAVRPASLLYLPMRNFFGNETGHGRFHRKNSVPSGDFGANGKIEILAERIARPAASRLDGRAAPDPAGAVELK